MTSSATRQVSPGSILNPRRNTSRLSCFSANVPDPVGPPPVHGPRRGRPWRARSRCGAPGAPPRRGAGAGPRTVARPAADAAAAGRTGRTGRCATRSAVRNGRTAGPGWSGRCEGRRQMSCAQSSKDWKKGTPNFQRSRLWRGRLLIATRWLCARPLLVGYYRHGGANRAEARLDRLQQFRICPTAIG